VAFAIDLMDREPLVVAPDLPVPTLARLLLDARLDGACVVDQDKLVGVVTTMDLIFQEKRVQVPTYVRLLGALLTRGTSGPKAALDKITGRIVSDIMSADPLSVSFDASLEQIATLMVDCHVTIVPVLNDGHLVGVISKRQVVRAALAKMEGELDRKLPLS